MTPAQPLVPVGAVPAASDPVRTPETKPADAPTVAQNPTPPAGSPLGLGLGRLQIRLDGPRERVTDRQMLALAGKVTGGTPAKVLLYLNGTSRELSSSGSSFDVEVSLLPGLNRLRVVAQDWRGVEAEDSTTVVYTPPPATAKITIRTPVDGHSLSPEDPPFVLVEGKVDDPGMSVVWIVANEIRIPARVRQGHFRHAVPITAPTVRLWAEAASGAAASERSDAITVRAGAPGPAIGAIVFDWPPGAEGMQVEVRAGWRPNPARLDAPVTTTLTAFGTAADGAPPGVFYLRNLKGGVYTFWLHYRAPAGAMDVAPILIMSGSGASSTRKLRPIAVNGAGRAAFARILLPQGILWEQDDWFTGQSQSADTVTKFRLPEGVAWTERKADLR